MHTVTKATTILIASTLAIVGCATDDDDTTSSSTTVADTTGDTTGEDTTGEDTTGDDTTGDDTTGAALTRMLRFSFEGLEPLGDDYEYEGWIIVDDAPQTAGRFSVDDNGAPSIDAFEVDAQDADAAVKYVLTIEPTENDDPAPSAVHLVAGDFSDGAASLSVGDPAALATDFTDAAGSFILMTPTTADVPDDYNLGIWWLDPAAGPGAALWLPELPEGWVYEGWVVGQDGPVTTGRFRAADQEDSDAAGFTAGPDGAPPFPGQDFIDPAVDLVGQLAVISVEPEPDNSPGPFTLKPLVDMDVEDVGPGVLQDMGNNAEGSNPTGMAWFE